VIYPQQQQDKFAIPYATTTVNPGSGSSGAVATGGNDSNKENGGQLAQPLAGNKTLIY